MSVRVEHVGLWVCDLARIASFYSRWFGARIGPRYENPGKGFASHFLEFADGARLEIMTRTDVIASSEAEKLGFAHVAFAVGGEPEVDALARNLLAAGVAIESGPRRTGDGYYECVVRDPEGNRVEIAAG